MKNHVEQNLFPKTETKEWVTQSPRNKPGIRFQKGKGTLLTELSGPGYGMGRWIGQTAVEGGKSYSFCVSAVTEQKVEDIYVLLTLYGKDGNWIIREHAENVRIEGQTITFTETIAVPQEGVRLEAELWLKGCRGKIEWNQPVLRECPPQMPRKVRVALAYIAPNYAETITVDSNVEAMIQAVDNAGRQHPDMIVLSEAMYERSTGVRLEEAAQTQDGEMCRLMCKKAKEYHSYLIYNFHEYEDFCDHKPENPDTYETNPCGSYREYYNTSVLIDRQGQIIGKYRKNQLTVTEYEQGMTPGGSFPVFQTDFGTIGILICFDQYFPQTAQKMADNGAEIVFVSSAGDAAEKFSARAMDTGIYFAVCGWNTENNYGWKPARVVSPTGEILAQSGTHTIPAVCDIDLNKRIRRHWLSTGAADTQIKGVYRYERNGID